MGQYWKPVNLTAKEYVRPEGLGSGHKLWEQLANHPSAASALLVLTAAHPEPRGGGDFRFTDPPRGNKPAANYAEIAERTIGRWAGHRIAFVGDYGEAGDLPGSDDAGAIYHECEDDPEWTDVTEDVATVLEAELRGRFETPDWVEDSSGWRKWVPEDEAFTG